jgi:hypothetical protein
MHIVVAAWSMDVKPETIRNCFAIAEFAPPMLM